MTGGGWGATTFQFSGLVLAIGHFRHAVSWSRMGLSLH
jgi:hypothetical protein